MHTILSKPSHARTDEPEVGRLNGPSILAAFYVFKRGSLHLAHSIRHTFPGDLIPIDALRRLVESRKQLAFEKGLCSHAAAKAQPKGTRLLSTPYKVT